MAKSMARVDNGIVVNMEWVDVNQDQTETLIELNDRPVEIGDTYDGAYFYRDGEKVLSPLEQAQEEIAALREENAMLTACVLEMSEIVYA